MKFPATKNDQKGQALLMVLLMTVAILLVGSAALTMGTTVRKTAVHEVNQDKAYYIAEAGVEKALAKAQSDPDWTKARPLRQDFDEGGANDEVFITNENYPESNGTIKEVRVIKTGEANNAVTIKIRSKGSSGDGPFHSNRTITVSATLKYPGNLFKDVAIYSKGLDLGKGLKVTGNIYSRGNITLESKNGRDEDTVINGNIYAIGKVWGNDDNGYTNSTINGKIYVDSSHDATGKIICTGGIDNSLSADELSALMPVEENINSGLLSPEKLDWYKNNSGFYTLPDNMNFEEGIYYINGNIDLSGQYSGKAIIVVDGEVSITDELKRKNPASDCLTILATGEIKTPERAHIEIHALLYSNEKITIKNKVTLIGSAISENVVAPWANHGHITVTYDSAMVEKYENITRKNGCFVKINSWKE